jgi:choline kinase
MKAAPLAAGVGRRLDPRGTAPPKALLRFAGKSLLQRHRAALDRDFPADLGRAPDPILPRLVDLPLMTA